MTTWIDLEANLEEAAERGQPLCFWWRDDDVGPDHPDFARLLAMAKRWFLPVALAVVPFRLVEATHAQIVGHPTATVIQHGFSHRNYAPESEEKTELGWRAPKRILEELAEGRRILQNEFEHRFLPVLAPPWNNIDTAVVLRLPEAGFVGLSTGGRRACAEPVPGLVQVNVHVDLVDWRRGEPKNRPFIGEGMVLAGLVAGASADEPIGIMTHHRNLDQAAWAFLDRLLGLLASHPGAEVLSARQAFAPDATDSDRVTGAATAIP